jgi:hypothetical protein
VKHWQRQQQHAALATLRGARTTKGMWRWLLLLVVAVGLRLLGCSGGLGSAQQLHRRPLR